MSFSGEMKEEIARLIPMQEADVRAELSAIIPFLWKNYTVGGQCGGSGGNGKCGTGKDVCKTDQESI